MHRLLPIMTTMCFSPIVSGAIADCDTSAFIYLSVAEALSLPVHLVDTEPVSGTGHNYLRWVDASGEFLDWDTNGRAQCATPAGRQKHWPTEKHDPQH